MTEEKIVRFVLQYFDNSVEPPVWRDIDSYHPYEREDYAQMDLNYERNHNAEWVSRMVRRTYVDEVLDV